MRIRIYAEASGAFKVFTWGILPVAMTVSSLHSNTDGASPERAKWGLNSCYVCVKPGATESASWRYRWTAGSLKKLQATCFLCTGPVSDGRVRLIYRSARAPFFIYLFIFKLALFLCPSSRWTRCRKPSSITPSASLPPQRGGTSPAACASWGSTHRWASFLLKEEGKSSEVTAILPQRHTQESHSISAGHISNTSYSNSAQEFVVPKGWIRN